MFEWFLSHFYNNFLNFISQLNKKSFCSDQCWFITQLSVKKMSLFANKNLEIDLHIKYSQTTLNLARRKCVHELCHYWLRKWESYWRSKTSIWTNSHRHVNKTILLKLIQTKHLKNWYKKILLFRLVLDLRRSRSLKYLMMSCARHLLIQWEFLHQYDWPFGNLGFC